jgi:hypothetical protein
MLAVVLALAAPATASAADWYVADTGSSDANTCVSGSPCATIGYVVGLAGVHDGDTVHVAAGTYNENVATSKRLAFVGAGPGTPSSSAGSSFVISPASTNAFDLTGGGSIANMRARGHTANANTNGNGIVLRSSAVTSLTYALSNVIAIGGSNTNTNSSALGLWATASNAGSALTLNASDLYVTSPLNLGEAAQVQAQAGTDALGNFTRTTFAPGGNARGLEGLGTTAALNVTDSTTVTGPGTLGIAASGPLSITRSNIAAGADAVTWTGTSPLAIADSLLQTTTVVASPREALDLDAIAPGTASASITGSTIVMNGQNSTHGALTVTSQSGSTLNLSVTDTIMRSGQPDGTPFGNDIKTVLNNPGGVINFGLSHSSYTTVSAATPVPAAGSGTNISGDPGFASFTGGNYALAGSSPLVDRGDAAALLPGELDLAQQPRSLDGNGDCIAAPDVGALELTGAAGAAPQPTASGPAVARPGKAVTFTATPATGYTLTWSFSGGGTASGASVSHTFTATGTQTATVVASRGGCTAAATASIVIDGTRPSFSKVSVKHKKLTFKLSEDASVKVTVLRRKRHHHKYSTLGSFTIKGKKGTHSYKLPTKVKGHRLTAGSYEVKLVGTDPAGNKSHTKTKTFSL